MPPLRGHRVIAKDTKVSIDTATLPASYRSNTPGEEHLLQVAGSFSCQYGHLCPDRVPLFLCPLNECQVPVRPGPGAGRAGRGLHSRGRKEGATQPCPGPELKVREGQRNKTTTRMGPGPEHWAPPFQPCNPGHLPGLWAPFPHL